MKPWCPICIQGKVEPKSPMPSLEIYYFYECGYCGTTYHEIPKYKPRHILIVDQIIRLNEQIKELESLQKDIMK